MVWEVVLLLLFVNKEAGFAKGLIEYSQNIETETERQKEIPLIYIYIYQREREMGE